MLLPATALALTLLAPAPQDQVHQIPDCQLSIDLSDFEGLQDGQLSKDPGVLRSWWFGGFAKSRIRISVFVYSNENYSVSIPEDLIDISERHHNSRADDDGRTTTDGKGSQWHFDTEYFVPGPYGYVPYAVIGEKLDSANKPPQSVFCMAGVTKENSYTIEIDAKPPLDAETSAKIISFLKDKVRYAGEVYTREWKDEEILERWERHAPEELAGDLEIFRTKHFVIMTNSSGKKKFAKELEKSYTAIKKMYPFEEREDLRLLPIYLFRTSDQYFDFCVRALSWSRDQAKQSKGVASRDFYATWYEAPKDLVHIHELTHQLFANRLRLRGGGSWFQEGVAEYMSTSKNDRGEFKSLVKKERYVSFAEFFARTSLLQGSGGQRLDGTRPSREAYLQAACITEFVHKSKWSKGKLQEFIHAVGRTGRGDLAQIETELQRVFGVGVEGFEEQFVAYWKKR